MVRWVLLIALSWSACDQASPTATPGDGPTVAAVDAGAVDADAAGGADSAPDDLASDLADGPPLAPGRVTWLLHLTDLHFGANDKAQPRLAAVLAKTLPVLEPAATVVTGDIVDEGNDEPAWKLYRHTIVDADVVSAFPRYLEVPGNHDLKKSGAAAYLSATASGQAKAGLHGQSLVDTPAGRVRLLRVNTADSDSDLLKLAGAFSQQQLDGLLALPAGAAPPWQTVVAGHHSLIGLVKLIGPAEARLKQLLAQRQAAVYLCGHVHLTDLGWIDSTLVVQGPSLGKNSEPAAMVVALDPSGPVAREVPLSEEGDADWPLVMVTSPADVALGGGNPHAKPAAPPEVTVRALVFAPGGIDAVRARFAAGGQPSALARTTNPHEWTGVVPLPTSVPAGGQGLTVEAISPGGKAASDTIVVTVAP